MARKLNRSLKAIDLFSGAGGFSLGLEKAGIEVTAAIEFDQKIIKTYSYNHPFTFLINEDIQNIKVVPEDSTDGSIILSKFINLDNIDIVFGGPPCQGFSMSGNRIRKKHSFFNDDRNKLFLDFFRFVKYIKPSIFIIENVPGILNFEDGSVIDEIVKKFSGLSYDVSFKILSAEFFGVPQRRKRAFIIGTNLNIPADNFFPEETNSEIDIVTTWDAIGDLPSLKSGEGFEPSEHILSHKSNYQKLMRNNNDNIFYNHISSKHTQKTIDLIKLIKPGQSMKDLPIKYRTRSVHSGAYGRMEKNKPSYTITTRINTPSVGRITHPVDNRTITPREAARIQSFPDNYRFLGDITTIGIQIGNSVPPLLAQSIGEKILKVLELNKAPKK